VSYSENHNRRSIRLTGYVYSQARIYFITIVRITVSIYSE